MTHAKSSIRFLIGAALISSTVALAGCGSDEHTTRTTTTDQTVVPAPAPVSSSTTTTTTRQSN